jgi:hypothetical protein
MLDPSILSLLPAHRSKEVSLFWPLIPRFGVAGSETSERTVKIRKEDTSSLSILNISWPLSRIQFQIFNLEMFVDQCSTLLLPQYSLAA